ncbi:MAG: hypothetical protein R3C52_02925 [Hyphomonadaceae bacterium]
MRHLAGVCAAVAGACLHAPDAVAGAWAEARGETLEIDTISREVGDFGETWRAESFFEHGFGGGWGGHFKAENQIRLSDLYDDRFAFEAGLKRAFALGERSAFSVQASYLGGEALDGPECTSDGYEVRAALGGSREFLGREAFVNVETAERRRNDDCRRVVTEVAAGIELVGEWRGIAKAWTQTGGGRTTKYEINLMRDFGGSSLGIGYRREVSGLFDEEGVLLSWWRRY